MAEGKPTVDTFRQKFPELRDKPTSDVIYEVAEKTGASPDLVAYELGENPGEYTPDEPGFKTSVDRGYGLMVQGAGSTLRDLGAESAGEAIEASGRHTVRHNPAEFDTVGGMLRSPIDATSEALGEMLPQVGSYAAGAATGARLGSVFGAPGAAVGGAVGGLAPLFTSEYGNTRVQQREEGTEDIGRALATAGVSAALERFGAEKVAGSLLQRGMRSAAREAGESRLKYAGKEALKGAAVEGPLTEAPQTFVQQYGVSGDPADLTSDETLQEAGVATMKGALGGGAFQGGVGLMTRPNESSFGTPETPDDGTVTPETADDILQREIQQPSVNTREQVDLLTGVSRDTKSADARRREIKEALEAPPEERVYDSTGTDLELNTTGDLLAWRDKVRQQREIAAQPAQATEPQDLLRPANASLQEAIDANLGMRGTQPSARRKRVKEALEAPAEERVYDATGTDLELETVGDLLAWRDEVRQQREGAAQRARVTEPRDLFKQANASLKQAINANLGVRDARLSDRQQRDTEKRYRSMLEQPTEQRRVRPDDQVEEIMTEAEARGVAEDPTADMDPFLTTETAQEYSTRLFKKDGQPRADVERFLTSLRELDDKALDKKRTKLASSTGANAAWQSHAVDYLIGERLAQASPYWMNKPEGELDGVPGLSERADGASRDGGSADAGRGVGDGRADRGSGDAGRDVDVGPATPGLGDGQDGAVGDADPGVALANPAEDVSLAPQQQKVYDILKEAADNGELEQYWSNRAEGGLSFQKIMDHPKMTNAKGTGKPSRGGVQKAIKGMIERLDQNGSTREALKKIARDRGDAAAQNNTDVDFREYADENLGQGQSVDERADSGLNFRGDASPYADSLFRDSEGRAVSESKNHGFHEAGIGRQFTDSGLDVNKTEDPGDVWYKELNDALQEGLDSVAAAERANAAIDALGAAEINRQYNKRRQSESVDVTNQENTDGQDPDPLGSESERAEGTLEREGQTEDEAGPADYEAAPEGDEGGAAAGLQGQSAESLLDVEDAGTALQGVPGEASQGRVPGGRRSGGNANAARGRNLQRRIGNLNETASAEVAEALNTGVENFKNGTIDREALIDLVEYYEDIHATGEHANDVQWTDEEQSAGAADVPVDEAEFPQDAILGYGDHPEWVQPHEDAVGGSTVYSDDTAALVEGYSALTGEPVYTAVSRIGDRRTRVDVEAFTGRLFDGEVKDRLVNAKRRHTQDMDQLAREFPDGPFTGTDERVVASDGLSTETAGVAREWARMLGLEGRVFLTTKTDAARADQYRLYGPYAAARSMQLQAAENGAHRKLSNGDHVILLGDSPRQSATLEKLAHEMGHAFEKDAYQNADAETKEAVVNAYNRHLEQSKHVNAGQWVRMLRAHTMGKLTQVSDPEMSVGDLPAYWTSFNEWFADQVSKWAVSSSAPQSAVETFFKRIGRALRRLYSQAAGKQYLPANEVKQYLDERVAGQPLQSGVESDLQANVPESPAEADARDLQDRVEAVASTLSETKAQQLRQAADMVASGDLDREFVEQALEQYEAERGGGDLGGDLDPQYWNDPDYRRQVGVRGTTVEKLGGWLSNPTSRLGNWVDVEFVQSTTQLQGQTGVAVPGDVRGMAHNGKVWLVADNIATKKAAKEVLAHEVVGHVGLESMLGQGRFNSTLKQVQNLKRTGNKQVQRVVEELKANYTDAQGNYTLDERQEAREVLAHMAEKSPDFGLVRRVVAWVRQWLARHGLGNIEAANLESLLVRAARHTRTNYSGFMVDNGKAVPAFNKEPEQPRQEPAAQEPPAFSRSGAAISMNRGETLTDRILASLPDDFSQAAEGTVRGLRDAAKKGHYNLAFTEDLADLASQALPTAKSFIQTVKEKATQRIHRERYAGEIVDRANSLDRETRDRMNDFLRRSTREQKWGYQPDWLGKRELDPAFKKEFEALPEEARTIIQDINRHGYTMLMEKTRVMNQHINEKYDRMLEGVTDDTQRQQIEADRAAELKQRGELVRKLQVGPYAPLKRFGKWVVVGHSADLKEAMTEAARTGDWKAVNEMKRDPGHYQVTFAETRSEAENLRRNIEEDTGMETDVAEKARDLTGENAADHASLERLRALVEQQVGEKYSRAIINQLDTLRLSLLSDDHALQQMKNPRRNIHGEDPDMVRAFAAQARADASMIASLDGTTQINEALQKMRGEADSREDRVSREDKRRLYNEFVKRYAGFMDYRPTPVQDKFMGTTSAWMLITSIPYYLQNLTQPFMMSLPWMTKDFGYGESWAELMKAYKDLGPMLRDAKQGSTATNFQHFDLDMMPDDARGMVNNLVDRGIIDITIGTDLGQFVADTPDGVVGQAGAWFDRTIRRLPALQETINRTSTAITAYRLAKNKKQMSDAEAQEYAYDVVRITHGDYTDFNTPWAISPNNLPGAKMLFQFRKFQIIQVSFLARLVSNSLAGSNLTKEQKAGYRQALKYTLAHTGVMAGGMGMPAMTTAAWAMGTLDGIFGDDEEPPVDVERAARQGLVELGFSDSMVDVVMNGVPAAFNVPLTTRVGMGTALSLLPFTDVDLTSRTGYTETITAAMGPTVGGLGLQWAQAMGDLYEGDLYGGLYRALPGNLGDAAKAYKMATEGLTSGNGDVVLSPEELSTGDVMLQALGFPSTTQTDRWFARNQLYQWEQHLAARTSQLKKQYTDGGPEERREAIQKWRELQRAKRENGFSTSPLSDLLRAPQQRQDREEESAGGVRYDSGNEDFVKQTVDLVN